MFLQSTSMSGHVGLQACRVIMKLFTQSCHMCRCPDLGVQRRLQVAKLLYERGRQLRGSPMLFELVTMLPDALTAASRSPVQTAVLPGIEQPAQAAGQPTDQQVQSKDRAAQHRQRPSKHEHSQRAINVGQESALLQVGLCQLDSYESGADMGCLQARIFCCIYDGLLGSLRNGMAPTAGMLLQERWKACQTSSSEARMRAVRTGLPAHDRRAAFLQSLQQSRVVVVQGATGSGKSTQMPQYILEEVSASFRRVESVSP